MSIHDSENRQISTPRSPQRWLTLLGFLLIIGLTCSVFTPSYQRINRAVYVTVPVIVTDATTGQPVRGASVTFNSDEESLRRTYITDQFGAAAVVMEFIAKGTRFDPIYNSIGYSTDGIPLQISASGYVPNRLAIPDQKEDTLFGVGTHPVWRINAYLQAATKPSRE